MSLNKVLFLTGLFAVFGLLPAAAQQSSTSEEKEGSFSLGMAIGIGVQNYANPAYVPGGTEPEFFTYQSLSLIPDIVFGKFAIGLGLTLNYRFTSGPDGDKFDIRDEDWQAEDLQEFLDVYLPKIRYIRYGTKGDPLFAKMGTIEDATLGNGYIMSNYSNALFLPETRLFGLSLDLDGKLINFPYIGFNGFVANLARFDIVAARLYGRPLAGSPLPLLREFQIGATFVTDSDPGYFAERYSTGSPGILLPSDASVLIYGADFHLPLLTGDILKLSTFGDYVFQKEGSGGMLGFGGRLIRILTYEAQIRYSGDNFIPSYFGASYDLFRPEQYLVYDGITEKKGGMGWFASMGLSALQNRLVVYTSMEGPFNQVDGNYYSWQGVFMVKEGLMPGFFFDILYDKKNMSGFDDFLRWREEALIRARINFRTGPAIITLVYNLRYDASAPGDDKWRVTSGIESKIELF
jgi:hypothetical protein